MPKTSSTVTTPLKDKDVIYCMEKTNIGCQNTDWYVLIPCKSEDDAFLVQDYLVRLRDDN